MAVDGAGRHAAERVPRRRVDHRQVEVADEQDERDVHQPVVEDDRAVEAEAVVALAEPEQEAGGGEEDGERGGQDRVQLLAGVEAALRTRDPPQPEAVVAVDDVELARGAPQRAAVAEEDDQPECDRPGDRGVDVHVLDEGAAADGGGEARQVEDEAAPEQDEEGGRVDPVHPALRRGEPADRVNVRSHSSSPPKRPGRSRAAPSTRARATRSP